MVGEKASKTLSSFSILLIILIVLAIVTVAMAEMGVQGIKGATIADVATAPVRGFADALPVCLFVLVLGGFLGIVAETGALDAGIAALVRKLKGNELVLIPILMFIFSIGGTTYGMCEETVPFYLLLAATMVAAGFDSLVGASVVLLGAGCGVLGSTVNPFAVGAAVDALSGTGLEVNQGVIIALGVVLWLVTLVISIMFVMRYAKKVKADKGSTFLSLQERETMVREFGRGGDVLGEGGAAPHENANADEQSMTGRQKAALVAFALAFVVMIVGFIPWEDLGVDAFNAGAAYEEVIAPVDGQEIADAFDRATDSQLILGDGVEGLVVAQQQVAQGWSAFLTGLPLGQWYFDEASTWFLVMALVIGFIGGLSERRFVKSFIGGAADMMSVVLVIALARSITVLMGETGLDLWILENAANALAGVAAFVFAPLSYALYLVLSFLIPSSSGMATVSMPIMGPLAAELGFSVEVMIMIFSAGNGLINMITPTSAAIMGGLALAKVEYTTWVKFSLKLMVVLGVVSAIILTGAMMVL